MARPQERCKRGFHTQDHKISKVGTDPASHFVGKNLDQKLAAKLTKEFKLTKGGRAYDAIDIEDEAL